jgi:DNA-binding Xre family transcriptional regulator
MAKPLREHRRAALLTSTELAEKAGLSPATVWRIEGGKVRNIHISTMRKIAEALAVKPKEISEFAIEQ